LSGNRGFTRLIMARRPARDKQSRPAMRDVLYRNRGCTSVGLALVLPSPSTATPRAAGLPSMLVVALVAAAVVVASGAASTLAAGLPLTTVARVPLSGPANRFDYTSFDPGTGWLWISHMDGDRLLAFDTKSRRIVKTIPAPGVHGVIAVPALGRVYASATNAQQVLTIDSHTGKILNHAPAGQYPDGLAYDPVERHIYVSDESGGVETVINAAGNRIATIPLGGEAGNVQYDNRSGKVLVDVQTRDDIAVIDPRTNRIVRRIPVPSCVSDHSLYIDSPHRLAFVTCDGNATLLTLDLRTMKFTGRFDVGDSPDVLAFDSSLRRLYVSAESGTVAVFVETGHAARRLGLSFLANEAHTVAVDPRTHLVYFPLQSGSTGGPQLLIMRPT
jgi:DNA-binding beta-propeller fold protein YncE